MQMMVTYGDDTRDDKEGLRGDLHENNRQGFRLCQALERVRVSSLGRMALEAKFTAEAR
jgi:hypothetical protein